MDAHSLDALEWEALAAGWLDAPLRAEVLDCRQHLEQTLESVPALHGEMHEVIQTAYRGYSRAMDKVFALIEGGWVEQARLYDHEQVDTSFDDLKQALAHVGDSYHQQARRACHLNNLGSALTILAGALVTGMLFQQFGRLRRRATAIEQAALQRSEEQFRALVQYASDVILTLVPDGTIRYASAPLHRILGHHPVLVSLVDNAIKFTAQGEIVVQLKTETHMGDALWIHVAVRDTGIGILPEQQQAIFDPFAQADGSTTRRYGGTGLGLAIVKQLVELMAGRLWIESAPGRGSTFHCIMRLGIRESPTP